MPLAQAAPKAKASKKEKDPNAPKKALGSYMHFAAAKRGEIKAAHPDATIGEVGKLLGAAWKRLSDKDKAAYEELARKDKERYEREKARYEGKK